MASHKRGGQMERIHCSCAHRELRGLRFISSNKASNAWREVQANFDRLARDGYLSRSDFAECIGMTESKEFALELFDTLSRRRQMKLISKEELREIWQQITDNSFDSRLQIFFNMYCQVCQVWSISTVKLAISSQYVLLAFNCSQGG